ncbi:glycosyltransferase family 2 protein [Legionella clemsonensis]|uniref:N-acetylglucosaminyl-diphospho-decaprenol L-rhamnosyltransferase n=1 Tax=Legionella clemsonensis TaxID=1867846 RepID=A0A222P3K1_9GAMM|nr:glycosyltransferase family 2 protein [Legionella clemsonensis]ASQ46413.1 N-acetylglucosaminyl-diphospho-decaprenol L-rhamnosyltransferase [Legionella clemsonensis]
MSYQYNDSPCNPINIAVVIVNYNSSEYLLKAMQALAKQNFKPSQVIILDNASSTPLPEEIKRLELPLKIVMSPINLGFAAGNNKAMKYLAPQINWIALLNPDAYPHADWLLEIVKTIHRYPEYAFMGSKLICEKEPHLLDGTGDVYHISGKAWRKNHRKPLTNDQNEIKEIFSPCAAAAVYRRDAIMAVQGFDENFFCYYEDIDLAFRLRLLGYKGCYVPKSVADHTGSATTQRHSNFYTYHGHRNLVWTYFKNMPLLLLIMTLPLHLLLNITTLFLFTVRGQTVTIFKSKKDAVKGLKTILKQRRAIQRSRTLSTRDLLKILEKGLPW